MSSGKKMCRLSALEYGVCNSNVNVQADVGVLPSTVVSTGSPTAPFTAYHPTFILSASTIVRRMEGKESGRRCPPYIPRAEMSKEGTVSGGLP